MSVSTGCPAPISCTLVLSARAAACRFWAPIITPRELTPLAAPFSPRPSGYHPRPNASHAFVTGRPLSGGMERRVPEGPLVLERIAGGDSSAVPECIDRFGGLVWSLARRMTFTTAEAEDAVQEIFVELWRNAGRYDRSVASETAFIAMIARRRLIDRRRRLDRQKDRAALPEDSLGSTDDIFARPALSEEAAQARRALAELSSEQQRVLRLSIFEGLSHERIATATGLPLGTVKTHARRGLIKLREILGLATPEAPTPPVARTNTEGQS